MQCNKEHSVVPNQTSEGAHENINQNNSSSVDNEVLNLDCNDNIISEGKAKIRNPKNVFYNPVQEFNRDLTVLVATRLASRKAIHQPIIFKKAQRKKEPKDSGIRILEALAATGLRSMRFALEVPNVEVVIANDYDQKAVEYIKQNAILNGVEDLVQCNCGDASLFMYQRKSFTDHFHLIDLDPYGSPTPFLDAAVQSATDGGILCITSTDMAVLCGNAPETCMSKYGVVAVRTKCCHELALRILLRSIESHANRYSRYIVPLLSLSVDFYCRVFVQIFTSQKEVKHSCTKLSHFFYCTSCSTPHFLPLCNKAPTSSISYKFTPTSIPQDFSPDCTVCGSRVIIAGPVWSEEIHHDRFVKELLGKSTTDAPQNEENSHDGEGNKDLVEKMRDKLSSLGTKSRIEGMLTVVDEELKDVPLYYDSDHLCSVLHCTCIPFLTFRSALLNGGYKVSSSHACKTSVKTNAPPNVVWDIMRCWVKENPLSKNRNIERTPAQRILSQPIKFNADFSLHPQANPKSRSKGLLRWQVNPEKFWGPKPKATRSDKKEPQKTKKKHKTQQDKSEFLCKKLKLADCPFGDKCVYRHEDS